MASASDLRDPRAEAGIELALRSIGHILHLGEMQETVLDHLKARLRGALAQRRRSDPGAILTPEIIAIATGYIKETYGIDQPRNIHAAPAGPDARAADAGEGAFFDRLGRNPFDRMVAGNGIAGFYGGSTNYSGLAGATYDPSRGIATLTAQNFGSSPFAAAGLDLPTTRYLAAQGFSSAQIIHAGQDAAALGFSPRDREHVRAFAVLDRVDPSGRPERNAAYAKYSEWLKQNKDQIKALQDAVDNAPDEAARKAAIEARDKFVKGGQDQTGVTAVGDRIDQAPTPPGMQPGAGRGAHDTVLNGLHQKQLGVGLDVGIEAHRGQGDAPVAAETEAGAQVKAQNDEAAKTLGSEEGTAGLIADLDIAPGSTVVDTAAVAKPVTVAEASVTPPKDGAKDEAKGEEVAADPKKKPAVQVAAIKGPSIG